MLVVFKSAPILKRALKVKQAMMQLYVLKLLKVQTKYLGRQWRKSNMKTMSAIYQKVRHRLNDDWAYGNGEFKQRQLFSTEHCSELTQIYDDIFWLMLCLKNRWYLCKLRVSYCKLFAVLILLCWQASSGAFIVLFLIRLKIPRSVLPHRREKFK